MRRHAKEATRQIRGAEGGGGRREGGQAIQKANDNFFKAVKDDEVKKCEDWKAKGADINYINDKGHSAVHVAAAFGALNVLRYLHKQGASFETINAVSLTP